MKNILKFLIEVSKLKEMPRTGWIWLGVKNPETIAEHIFRVTMMNWILAEMVKPKLNLKKVIKISLAHDLCEVYAGDMTPYWKILPQDEKNRKKILKRWIKISRKEKEKLSKEKFVLEKKSLFKLINFLKPETKKDILSSWQDYERGISREGKFVKQVDKIETLIQAIEYLGTKKDTPVIGWWEEVEELVEEPLLLKFLKVIQKKLYGRAPKYKKNKNLENILDFIFKIGSLKKLSRAYWIMRQAKNPETVAGHIFTLAIIVWVFSKERFLNIEKLLKMAFCHELTAVYTGDTTPYDKILPKEKKKMKELLKKSPRLSKKKREKIFLKDYQEEKKAIKKLVLKLKPSLKKEINDLWEEYRTRSSQEGCFLSQLNVLAVLFQGLLHERRDKNFYTNPIWEWAFEMSDSPLNLKFMKEMRKEFYGNKRN